MLSNRKGQELLSHLIAVANMASAMGVRLGLPDTLINLIYISALFHDIGKVYSRFQTYIKKINESGDIYGMDIDDSLNINYPLHHEISWAYLINKIGNREILNAIYWHHASPIRYKKIIFENSDAILDALSDKDKKTLDKWWNIIRKILQDKNLDVFLKTPIIDTFNVPDMFEKTISLNSLKNSEFMLIRSCVISADRHVSALSKEQVIVLAENSEMAESEIDNILEGSIRGQALKPIDYDQYRYNSQIGVVESLRNTNSNTLSVNAPAGFGKTLIAILWAAIYNVKTIWICPRNAVAETVYDNIIRELDALGLSCSVELYLTGLRQKTNIVNGRPEFFSDIIVTNIDAVMSPMVNNRVAGRLFAIFGANIVIDEFHEIVSNEAIFAAFITYMRARHRISDSCKTLLISATPSFLNFLWDSTEKKTQFFPDKNRHYQAAHSGKYKIGFSDTFPIVSPGACLICNSVSGAQRNFLKGYTHILHHKFIDTDRKINQQMLFESFGKGKNGVLNGESLSAALVVQAAMDISFLNMYDSVCSPESTLQRQGRCDRWGDFQYLNPSIIFLLLDSENSERSAIRKVYDNELNLLWYYFLKESLKNSHYVNMDYMYEIYNDFNKLHENKIKRYLLNKYETAMNGKQNSSSSSGLISYKSVKILGQGVIKSSKGMYSRRNLRSSDGSYFYTVEYVGKSNEWVPPEEVLSDGEELRRTYDRLDMDKLNSGKMLFRLKGLVNSGYNGWLKQSKGKSGMPNNLNVWFKRARNSGTPLPDFTRQYHEKLGVIRTTKIHNL